MSDNVSELFAETERLDLKAKAYGQKIRDRRAAKSLEALGEKLREAIALVEMCEGLYVESGREDVDLERFELETARKALESVEGGL